MFTHCTQMDYETDHDSYEMKIPGLGIECSLVFLFSLLLQTWLIMVCGGRPMDPAAFDFGVWPQMVRILDPHVTGLFGIPLGAASILSIVAISLGLCCFHFANRLHGAHRDQSYLMLILFLALPATMSQIIAPSPMGVFLGAMGVVYLCATLLVTRPTVFFVSLFGLATASSFTIHWLGLFLPLLLLPWVLLRNRDLYGDLFPHFLLGMHAILVHALLILSTLLLGPRFSVGITEMRFAFANLLSPAGFLQTTISEVLIPFFPLVLAAIPALLNRDLKWRITGTLVAAIPFLLVTLGMGSTDLGAGALLLPVAFASLLCLRDLLEERAILAAAAVVALLFGGLSFYEARFQDGDSQREMAHRTLPLKTIHEDLGVEQLEKVPLDRPTVPGKE